MFDHDLVEAMTSENEQDPDIDQRFADVYAELKRLAHKQLANERPSHTLSTTALVHESYLKLAGDDGAAAATKQQFFALAARAMRRVLVDNARRRNAVRRGRSFQRLPFDELAFATLPIGALGTSDGRMEEVLALEDALTKLKEIGPRLSQVVELRFFGGLTEKETAGVLGVTEKTVARDWVKARALLSTML